MNKKGPKKMVYPKEAEAKLKESNRQLRAEVKRLKKALTEANKKEKQYEEVLARNFEHMSEMMDGVTVEEAIRAAKKIKRAKAKPDTKQLVREKFRNMFKEKKGED